MSEKAKQYQVTITRLGIFCVEATSEEQAEKKAIERLEQEQEHLDNFSEVLWFDEAQIDNIEEYNI